MNKVGGEVAGGGGGGGMIIGCRMEMGVSFIQDIHTVPEVTCTIVFTS